MLSSAATPTTIDWWYKDFIQISFYPETNVTKPKLEILVRTVLNYPNRKYKLQSSDQETISKFIEHYVGLRKQKTKKVIGLDYKGILYEYTGHRRVEEILNILIEFDNTKLNGNAANVFKQCQLPLIISIQEKSKQKNKPIHKTNKFPAKQTLTRASTGKSIVFSGAILSKKTGQPITYFFKHIDGSLSEIETYMSLKYAILLGKNRVGLCKVLAEDNMRRGTRSRGIPGFISLTSIYNNNNDDPRLEDNFLISAGYGKIETANYIFRNPDAHWRNVGLNIFNELCIIDFDYTLPCFTYKYRGFTENHQIDHNNSKFPAPSLMYVIHPEDIINLPKMKHAKPFNGLQATLSEIYRVNVNQVLDTYKNDFEFINDKWYTFLKYLIVFTDELDQQLASVILADKTREFILTDEHDRKEELLNTLLEIPDFIDYVINNDVLSDIINELQEFKKFINFDSVKDEYLKLKILVEQVKNQNAGPRP